MKRTFFVVAIVSASTILVSLVYMQLGVFAPIEQSQGIVEINGKTVRVEIAGTPSLRARGLGGHSSLLENEGMLFVFPVDGKYSFWMKDMLFPIDIVWIAADGHIVDIARNVSPETYPQTFEPSVPVRYVLELPAGYSDAHNVLVGDRVRLW